MYIFLITLLMSEMALAALPPTAESMRRMKAIIESKEVYDSLGSVNWIRSIKEVNDTEYLLQTDKCTLKVEVKSATNKSKRHFVGPPELEVIVDKLQCK